MAAIDEAALRIVRTILAFDEGHKEYGMEVVGSPEHIALAKEAAEKAITLIKNDGVLPLQREAVKKIAVIGHLADTAVIGDHGSSWVRPPYVVTPLEGLQKANPGAETVYDDGSDLERAKALAAAADAVVFVVGFDHDDEGEFISDEQTSNYTGSVGGDRKATLGLHAEDIALIQAVGPANPKTAVVLVGGNTIMMTEWYGLVPAVLMAYYPGMEGGTALAEILYGDVNPSGTLPYVVPVSEADLPQVDWEATDQYYEYYHGYTRLEKNGVAPLVPYGFGLSYTTFETDNVAAEVVDGQLVVTATVRNTGSRDGEEVVQVYAGYANSAVDRPVKQLCGFQRVFVPAGGSATVAIETPLDKLRYYDPVSRAWVLEKMAYPVFVGSSSAAGDLKQVSVTLA
jgi:beta-glucosidase